MKTTRIHRLVICVFVMLTSFVIQKNIASAEGGINTNEQRVIIEAQGTFEYDGEVYTARQQYVDQLYQYLSKEDVNLTSEEADNAITQMYANVETGVKEGYIVKVDSIKDDIDRSQVYDVTEISPEEKDQGITDVNEVKDKNREILNNRITQSVIDKNDEGSVVVKDISGKEIYKKDGPLKNTGFSIRDSIITSIVLGVVLICVGISTVLVILAERKHY